MAPRLVNRLKRSTSCRIENRDHPTGDVTPGGAAQREFKVIAVTSRAACRLARLNRPPPPRPELVSQSAPSGGSSLPVRGSRARAGLQPSRTRDARPTGNPCRQARTVANARGPRPCLAVSCRRSEPRPWCVIDPNVRDQTARESLEEEVPMAGLSSSSLKTACSMSARRAARTSGCTAQQTPEAHCRSWS